MRIKFYFSILVLFLLGLGGVLLYLAKGMKPLHLYIVEGIIAFILVFLFIFYRKIVKPMNIIGSVRNLIFAALVKKGKSTTPWIIVFSVLTVVFGVLTWAGPISLLAIAGKLITTVAYGMKNPSGVRLLTIPSCLCWGVYNALNFSLAGICTEAFSLASIIAGEVRYRKFRKTGILSGKKETVVNASVKENKAF